MKLLDKYKDYLKSIFIYFGITDYGEFEIVDMRNLYWFPSYGFSKVYMNKTNTDNWDDSGFLEIINGHEPLEGIHCGIEFTGIEVFTETQIYFYIFDNKKLMSSDMVNKILNK